MEAYDIDNVRWGKRNRKNKSFLFVMKISFIRYSAMTRLKSIQG